MHLAAGIIALPAVSRIARAQAYPNRPIRIVVGFTAGSASDILTRLIGQWLSERFGQPFVIENRGGAGGSLGAEMVVRAAPDGYTLLYCSSADAINATVYDKGYEVTLLSGLGAPKNMPVEVVERLNKEVNAALADSGFKSHLADLGNVPVSMSSADFGKLLADETEKWAKVIRAANIKAE